MPQHATREHPAWCLHETSDHDPHTSAVERVAEDFPSDLAIEAYLLRHEKPIAPNAKADLAALEFNDPASGPDPITFLLTFGQLRHLSEALNRLIRIGEQHNLTARLPAERA